MHRAPRHPLLIRVIPLLMLAVGASALSNCRASGDSRNSGPRSSATSPTAAERLAARAAKEAAARHHVRDDVPAPPGVDPEVLLPARESAIRRLDLEEALRHVVERAPFRSVKQPARIEPALREGVREEIERRLENARAAMREGRVLAAATDLQHAHALDPEDASVLRELARCYAAVGNFTRAEQTYAQLEALEPLDPEALLEMAMAAANRREFDAAVATIAARRLTGAAFDHDPAGEMLADFTLSVSLRSLGYDAAAIEAATRTASAAPAIESDSRYASRAESVQRQRGELWRAVGDAHCRLQSYEAALDAYARAAELPIADPHGLRARVLFATLRLGRSFGAQRQLLLSLERGDDALSEAELQLFEYVAAHVRDADALADALATLAEQESGRLDLARAAATFMQPRDAVALLVQFFEHRRERDPAVRDVIRWLAARDDVAGAELAATLIGREPLAAGEFAREFAQAAACPSTFAAALRRLPHSPARALLESKLLSRFGQPGLAWSVAAEARERWPRDASLIVDQLELALALEEPMLIASVLADADKWAAEHLDVRTAARLALGRLDDAARLAAEAVATSPDSAEALLANARATAARTSATTEELARQSLAHDAAMLASRAADLHPDHEPCYELLLALHAPSGLLPDAAQHRQIVLRAQQRIPDSRLVARLAAEQSFASRRYEETLERCLAIFASDPDAPAALALAVQAWIELGREDAARRWIEDQLDARSCHPALLEQIVMLGLERGSPADELDRLRALADAEPLHGVAHRLLEDVLRAQGAHHEAAALGERRLLARPRGLRRELELAALYAGADRPAEAIERLRWIEEHPEQATLDHLVSALRIAERLPRGERGRDDVAAALAELAAGRFDDAPVDVYAAGLEALASAGRADDRFDALARKLAARSGALAADERSETQTWRQIAQRLIDQGHADTAARALHLRLTAGPEPSEPLFGQLTASWFAASAIAGAPAQDTIVAARALDERGRTRALQWLRSGQPLLAEVVFRLSDLYSLVGDSRGAERLLIETIRLAPDHEMALNNLGYTKLLEGVSAPQIVQFIERAAELAPSQASIIDTLGWLRYLQGQIEDQAHSPGAVTLLQRALTHSNLASPEMYDHLGDALWRIGRHDDAIKRWRNAADLIEHPKFRESMAAIYQDSQIEQWGLLVVDPEALYDSRFSMILEHARAKVKAAQSGEAPPVAPTFAERSAAE